MGGNAIKTVTVSRFDLATYNATKLQLKTLLREHLVIEFCYDIPEKTDFGDLDVLYQYKHQNTNIIDIIKQIFNPVEYHLNGTVLSFAYCLDDKYYQIDMVHTDDFDCFRFYFSYSDVGNIIGKMLKHYEVHFGSQGLFVKSNVGGAKKEIILTKNPQQICEFLGVDYNQWLNFKSNIEIYDWLISIKYFNSVVFFENLKYNDKVKTNRAFYQDFLLYIKDREVVSPIEKTDLTEKLIVEYKKMDILNVFIHEHKIDTFRKSKFNAKKFLVYGFEGKEIGITMNSFKKYIENGLQVDFNEWLDKHDDSTIIKYIDYYQTH